MVAYRIFMAYESYEAMKLEVKETMSLIAALRLLKERTLAICVAPWQPLIQVMPQFPSVSQVFPGVPRFFRFHVSEDEYGGTTGLITLEDVLEERLGSADQRKDPD